MQQQQQQQPQSDPTMGFHWTGRSAPQITSSSPQSTANRKYPRYYYTHTHIKVDDSFITTQQRYKQQLARLLAVGRKDRWATAENWSINGCVSPSARLFHENFLFSFFFHYFSKDGADLVIRKTERSTSPGSSRGVIGGTRRRTERTVVKSGPAAPAVVPILCSTWSRCTVASGIFASIFRVKKNKSFFFFPFILRGGFLSPGGKRKSKTSLH